MFECISIKIEKFALPGPNRFRASNHVQFARKQDIDQRYRWVFGIIGKNWKEISDHTHPHFDGHHSLRWVPYGPHINFYANKQGTPTFFHADKRLVRSVLKNCDSLSGIQTLCLRTIQTGCIYTVYIVSH